MRSLHQSPLRVRGRELVYSETLTPVRLRGINRSGLEYCSPEGSGALLTAGFSDEELDRIADWGGNLIRLPFNQSWALHSPGYDAEPYLTALDQIIEMAAARGLYTLLDLHWLDAVHPRGHLRDGSPNFVPPLPNLASLNVWRQLAARYRNEPAVLYDIFNEPHDPLPGDALPLDGIHPDGSTFPLQKRRVRAAEWHPWATHLINAIRSAHPNALVFISGLDWGYDLHDFPLPGIHNAVYSSHVYPNKKKSWDLAFGNLSHTEPVFIAEFGGHDTDLDWGRKLIAYLDERNLGWTAWSWSDRPHLIHRGKDFEPTLFGSLVRESLRNRSLS